MAEMKMEAVMELREAAKRFQEILNGLNAHEMVLTEKDKQVTLAPGAVVTFKVKAKSDKKKEKIELSLSWSK